MAQEASSCAVYNKSFSAEILLLAEDDDEAQLSSWVPSEIAGEWLCAETETPDSIEAIHPATAQWTGIDSFMVTEANQLNVNALYNPPESGQGCINWKSNDQINRQNENCLTVVAREKKEGGKVHVNSWSVP